MLSIVWSGGVRVPGFAGKFAPYAEAPRVWGLGFSILYYSIVMYSIL